MYNKAIFDRTFHYSKKYWYKNIKNIPRYFRDIRFLMKNGYDRYAVYDTFDWFTLTMKDILLKYKESHSSSPVLLQNFPYSIQECRTEEGKEIIKTNAELWNSTIDKLISSLEKMDENNPDYEGMTFEEKSNNMEKAKDEFFELFSKHFFDFWD